MYSLLYTSPRYCDASYNISKPFFDKDHDSNTLYVSRPNIGSREVVQSSHIISLIFSAALFLHALTRILQQTSLMLQGFKSRVRRLNQVHDSRYYYYCWYYFEKLRQRHP